MRRSTASPTPNRDHRAGRKRLRLRRDRPAPGCTGVHRGNLAYPGRRPQGGRTPGTRDAGGRGTAHQCSPSVPTSCAPGSALPATSRCTRASRASTVPTFPAPGIPGGRTSV